MDNATVIIYQSKNVITHEIVDLFHEFMRDDKLRHISYETSHNNISKTFELWLYAENVNKPLEDKEIMHIIQWFKNKDMEIVYSNDFWIW